MTLLDTPGINEAIVMSREDQHRYPSLVAYLVPTDQRGPSTSELRNFLMSRLPDCMIAAVFVTLIAMPLTTNGKVDPRALPDPGSARPNLDIVYTPPTTTMEARLTSIWSDVLSKNSVGVHGNFFDLGGHSLAASRIITRIVQTFQLELPVKTLFESPTVAEMAIIMEQNQARRADDEELAQMLRAIESMSEEDAQCLLGEQAVS